MLKSINFVPFSENPSNGVFNYFAKKYGNIVKKGFVSCNQSSQEPYNKSCDDVIGVEVPSYNHAFATNPKPGSWATYKLKYPLRMTHFSAATYNNNFWRGFTLEGCNDEHKWDMLLDTQQSFDMKMQSNLNLKTIPLYCLKSNFKAKWHPACGKMKVLCETGMSII